MITSSINVAVTGLQAAATRMATSAHNVANISSTAQVVRGETVQQTPDALEVQQSSIAPTGGVRAEVRAKDPGTFQAFLPDHHAANDEGIVEFPNVSLDEEIVTQQFASYNYEAGLKVIETADEMLQGLLDVTA